MSRIVLDLPEKFAFTTEIPIRISDINPAGHVGSETILALVNEARARFFSSHGYTEVDVEGLGIVVSDAAVVYRSEVFHGDVLQADVATGDFNQYGCDVYCRLRSTRSEKVVANAKTGIVFLDPVSKKPAAVPTAFLAKCS